MIGDALGAAIEFDSLDMIRRRYGPSGLTGYAHTYGRLGAITDDTQMTLFTAEGLLLTDSSALDDLVESIRLSYLAWLLTQDAWASDAEVRESWLLEQQFLHSRRAPGNTCLSALRDGGTGTPEDRINWSKGCGGIMRAAPAAAVAGDWFELGARAAALTHGSRPRAATCRPEYSRHVRRRVGARRLTERGDRPRVSGAVLIT